MLNIPHLDGPLPVPAGQQVWVRGVPLYARDIRLFSNARYIAARSPEVYTTAKPHSQHRLPRAVQQIEVEVVAEAEGLEDAVGLTVYAGTQC
jgi:hypothetical protein